MSTILISLETTVKYQWENNKATKVNIATEWAGLNTLKHLGTLVWAAQLFIVAWVWAPDVAESQWKMLHQIGCYKLAFASL